MREKVFYDQAWHDTSDQPLPVRDPELRRSLRAGAWREYGRTAARLTLAVPNIVARYCFPGTWTHSTTLADTIGVGLSIDRGEPERIADMLEELGRPHVLVRIPVWHRNQLDTYLRLLEMLPARSISIGIAQDRGSICSLPQWQNDVRSILECCRPFAEAVQIGQAINRLKWGCAHVGEYGELIRSLTDLREEFSSYKWLGSSVLDFEPAATHRSLRWQPGRAWDGIAAGLYVDRRGSPRSTQWGLFNAARKARLIAALGCAAGTTHKRLWVTEVNWPLQNMGEWAPAAGSCCVSEADAARYLRQYYEDLHATGLVERIYTWQLIARGYGLCDDAEGNYRRKPAFLTLQKLMGQ